MSRIKVSSRVSTEAWRFDNKSVEVDEQRWSFIQFREDWKNARVFGTVQSKSGDRWIVKWDIDGEENSLESDFLFKEDDSAPIQSKSIDVKIHSVTNNFHID